MAIVLRSLADDDLDRLFVWENDDRAVKTAAFTRADSSDRWSFEDHYHRIRGNPDCTVRAVDDDGVLVGVIGSSSSEVGREVTYWIDPGQWGRGLAFRRAPVVPGYRADPAAVRPGGRAQRRIGQGAAPGWFRAGRRRAVLGRGSRPRDRRDRSPA